LFYVRKWFAQLFSSYVLAKKALWNEKRFCKKLMKLTPDKLKYYIFLEGRSQGQRAGLVSKAVRRDGAGP